MRKGAPRLLAFTDPVRTPDPLAVAARLPAGAALVYRTFGAPEADAVAARLVRLVRARRGRLLIGADARLAARVGADGVHLPERCAWQARRLKALWPDWIVTCAAHSATAVRRAQMAGADAAVVSSVFPSRSASAGAPLGVLRLAGIIRTGGLPIYALGGVDDETAGQLKALPLAGFAGVDAF